MERTIVVSSNLESVGYDFNSGTLEVSFLKSGAIYRYANVPVKLYHGLLAAESTGKFFNQNIKSSFNFIKVA